MSASAKILVVDDSRLIREMLKMQLTPMGHSVHLAESGEAAIAAVREDPPDIILLDVNMKGMAGYEVAEALKAEEATRDIQIIMVSALTAVDARVAALTAGADDFLTKPVHPAELKARVATSLKLKAYHDQRRHYREELQAEVAEKTRLLRTSFKELQSTSLEIVMRLARAAEYKDDDTGEHLVRMSRYSEALAQQLGLPEEEAAQIRHAAPMHDLGKIGIPDRILLKPGKLDNDEWDLMRQHTTFGAEILTGSTHPLVLLGHDIALTHHEKWDGSGYPRGLTGVEIPLEGRIVAVADVFDALTSRRPYKEPFSIERSFEIIREGRERHFDPAIVDAFFGIEGELLDIKAQAPDIEFSPLVRFGPAPAAGNAPKD